MNRSSFAHRTVTTAIKGLGNILCKVDSEQIHRVPQRGPLILAANHINFLEVPLMYTHLWPRPIEGFVKSETLDDPILGVLLFKIWGGIPIRRGEPDMAALRRGLQMLAEGRILAIAPEGTRSGHGRLQQGHPGVALLALHSGAPILPVVCYGGEQFWPNFRRLRRTPFHIVVGQPFYVEANGNKFTRQVRQQMTREVMYQMAALLPPRYRGVYADLSSATERYLRFPPGAQSNLSRPSP